MQSVTNRATMTLIITIELDNDAFTEGSTEEVARILATIPDRLPYDLSEHSPDYVRDLNGNRCGSFEIRA